MILISNYFRKLICAKYTWTIKKCSTYWDREHALSYYNGYPNVAFNSGLDLVADVSVCPLALALQKRLLPGDVTYKRICPWAVHALPTTSSHTQLSALKSHGKSHALKRRFSLPTVSTRKPRQGVGLLWCAPSRTLLAITVNNNGFHGLYITCRPNWKWKTFNRLVRKSHAKRKTFLTCYASSRQKIYWGMQYDN